MAHRQDTEVKNKVISLLSFSGLPALDYDRATGESIKSSLSGSTGQSINLIDARIPRSGSRAGKCEHDRLLKHFLWIPRSSRGMTRGSGNDKRVGQ